MCLGGQGNIKCVRNLLFLWNSGQKVNARDSLNLRGSQVRASRMGL